MAVLLLGVERGTARRDIACYDAGSTEKSRTQARYRSALTLFATTWDTRAHRRHADAASPRGSMSRHKHQTGCRDRLAHGQPANGQVEDKYTPCQTSPCSGTRAGP